MSKTTWQETFKDSPRFAAIQSVFKLIEKPDVLVTEIWAKANRVMIDLNAEEREMLPALVRAELKNREPVHGLGHPSMG
jgi:hypothetical protein